tara:strand:- start:423 stop:845 length:423 start_codon:yes stop_codon:yes gene_type:complete
MSNRTFPGVPRAGLGHVGSYQVSGHPYISGSTSLAAGLEQKFTFPYVTRNVTVVNHSSYTLRVHFNSTSSGAVVSGVHYVELDSDEDSYTFNAKCKEIYVSAPATNGGAAAFRVIGELTGIETISMYDLTGSGLTTSDGS